MPRLRSRVGPSSQDFASFVCKIVRRYVWDLSNSALVKVIDGPKEDVVAMRWHPHQPVLVSVSVSGKVSAGWVLLLLFMP